MHVIQTLPSLAEPSGRLAWCAQKFQKLAEGLPWSKHVHSKLVCSITREIMDEHNPPMVLPNGAVYSERAVQHVASKNHGIFTCPKTGAHGRRSNTLPGPCAV